MWIFMIFILLMLMVLAAFLWFIMDALNQIIELITFDVHAYLIVYTQEFATCTPFVKKMVVHCKPNELTAYIDKVPDNVKITVTKLD